MLISSYCFGQSVPDQLPVKLIDVYNAVHAHTPSTTFSLVSCHANAIPAYFNPTYNQVSYSPDGGLLRFRDYKPTGTDPCSFPMYGFYNRIESSCSNYNITNNTTLDQACYDMFHCSSSNLLLYLNVRVEALVVGKQVYDGTTCLSLTFSGYFLVQLNTGTDTYKVHTTSGIIDSVATCP